MISFRPVALLTMLFILGAAVVTPPASAVTWSPRTLFNPHGTGDYYSDLSPALATDGHGNWVAVWELVEFDDRNIMVSRSTDNGQTWSPPAILNSTAEADGNAFDILPHVASGGNGQWIVVWSSRWNPVSGTPSSDYDILASRSTDNGLTWSTPAPVSHIAGTDSFDDYYARIAADRNGNWVVVWTAVSASTQQQFVMVARSTDVGASWSPVQTLNNQSGGLNGIISQPRIATDEFGTWMVVTFSDSILTGSTGNDSDIFGWRSTNNGVSWSAPIVINTNAATDSGSDTFCDIAADGRGTWVVSWATASLPGTSDLDIAVSRSTDDGITWSPPVLVQGAAASSDAGTDSDPVVGAHPLGGWMVVWNHSTAASGIDLLFSTSADGLNWSPASFVNSNAAQGNGKNAVGALVPVINGEWVALWSSTDAPLSSQDDSDLFLSRAIYYTGMVPDETDSYSTGSLDASVSGYASLGFNIPDLAYPEYSEEAGAYLAHIAADPGPPTRVRVSGVYSASSQWLRYADVGPGRYVRARYHVYAGGQADPQALNTIPNLRVRAGIRFAQTSILEVFNHMNGDPAAAPFSEELRPSQDPQRPSIYRVDLDPVDVPALTTNAETEGVLRGFEAYSIDPQDNGFLALTESSLGTYMSLLPEAEGPIKVYEPTQSDAGTLAASHPAEITRGVFIPGKEPGMPFLADESLTTAVVVTEGPFGVTLDTTAVPPNRIGVASREFFPGDDPTASDYVRVEPNRQYLVRFHLTSTRPASSNAQIRCRVRSVKWSWVQRFEIGGAWAIGTDPLQGNAALAQQSLPGFGCLNPDKRTPGEPGGWYTVLMHTPLSPDLRPEINGSLAEKMPRLMGEPGPGEPGSSFRDLKVGLDLLDTISPGPFAGLEQGHVTVDRIEVYRTRFVAD